LTAVSLEQIVEVLTLGTYPAAELTMGIFGGKTLLQECRCANDR
jgi:hypothetical protein